MKPIETVLQSQRKMYDFDKNPILGKRELDFVDAYRNAESYDEYIVNLTHQRPMDQDELEVAETMYDELTFKYEQ